MFIKLTATVRPWLLLGLMCILSFKGKATNYYFSSQQGDDTRTSAQAQNPATPWKTLEKVNAIFQYLQPGDSVLFKRGDEFYGQLTIDQSGTAALPIVISAYGSGTNPVITGFTELTNWVQYNSNIWSVPLNVAVLNLITINGKVRAMGRYPNSGFLTYTSHYQNQSISGSTVGFIPFDPQGAEVVIRKSRYILDRHPIISRTGYTLNYSTNTDYGDNGTSVPIDTNGYFIQNHFSTLDTLGDWYYDKTAKRLFMYMGSETPSNFVMKASTMDRNFLLNAQNYITFNGLSFAGSNYNGGYLVAANNISFVNCNFNQHGGNGFYAINVSNLSMKGGTVSHCLNDGIWVESAAHYSNIDSVTVYNSGMIPGAARSGDVAQLGIGVAGDHNLINKCSVIKCGYNGINFEGEYNSITNNFIDSVCLVKDDGGGIYTYTSDISFIKNNIVLHALGNFAGAEAAYWDPWGKAVGIYLDNGVIVRHATVSGNTIAHGGWGGILLNNNAGNTVLNNIVYDYPQQLMVVDYFKGAIRNTTIKNNQFIARTADQNTFYNLMYVDESPSLYGDVDSNYYARPINDSFTIRTTTDGWWPTYRSLAGWQAYSGVDLHSHQSPKTITDLNDLRFEYNSTMYNKTIPLDASYIDVTGRNYTGTITLAPFSSVILIKTSTSSPEILPLNLLAFTGKLQNDQVILSWQTSNEQNSSGFEVQKMTADKSWSPIGFVNAKGSVGTTNSYNFTDNNPVTGTNFYRLKIVDLDGKFVYSDVISINVKPKSNTIFQNSPNPFKSTTTIRYSLSAKKFVTIKIYNEAGVQVAILANEMNDPGTYQVQWNSGNALSGYYFCRVTIGEEVKTIKMLKII